MLAFPPRLSVERESKTYAGMDESRIHMTGSWLYDCITLACEQDENHYDDWNDDSNEHI